MNEPNDLKCRQVEKIETESEVKEDDAKYVSLKDEVWCVVRARAQPSE